MILAAGLAGLGYFIGNGLSSLRSNNRYVVVRGLSEREVVADTAQLRITFSNNGEAPSTIFPKLTGTQNQIAAFLKQLGLKEEEIKIGQWNTSRTSASSLKDDPTLPLYEVSGSISVVTHNVAAIQTAYKTMNELRIATDGAIEGTDVAYSFTGIGSMRAEMIAAATKDARNAALQFATDSGSRVGSINNASQGVFQIMAKGSDSDDSGTVDKTVRVVTTVNYELKD